MNLNDTTTACPVRRWLHPLNWHGASTIIPTGAMVDIYVYSFFCGGGCCRSRPSTFWLPFFTTFGYHMNFISSSSRFGAGCANCLAGLEFGSADRRIFPPWLAGENTILVISVGHSISSPARFLPRSFCQVGLLPRSCRLCIMYSRACPWATPSASSVAALAFIAKGGSGMVMCAAARLTSYCFSAHT